MDDALQWNRWHSYPDEEPGSGDLVDLELDKGWTRLPDDPTSLLKEVTWDGWPPRDYMRPVDADLKRWRHCNEVAAMRWQAVRKKR
jgi:hypothetical protein